MNTNSKKKLMNGCSDIIEIITLEDNENKQQNIDNFLKNKRNRDSEEEEKKNDDVKKDKNETEKISEPQEQKESKTESSKSKTLDKNSNEYNDIVIEISVSSEVSSVLEGHEQYPTEENNLKVFGKDNNENFNAKKEQNDFLENKQTEQIENISTNYQTEQKKIDNSINEKKIIYLSSEQVDRIYNILFDD